MCTLLFFIIFYALWCKIIIIIITVIITGLRSSIKDAPARMESVARQTTDNSGEGKGSGCQYMRTPANSVIGLFQQSLKAIDSIFYHRTIDWRGFYTYCAAVTVIARVLQNSEGESVCSGDDVRVWEVTFVLRRYGLTPEES